MDLYCISKEDVSNPITHLSDQEIQCNGHFVLVDEYGHYMYPAGTTNNTDTVLSEESLYNFMYFLTDAENTDNPTQCQYKFTNNENIPGWELGNSDNSDNSDVCWPQPKPAINTDASEQCDYGKAFMTTMPERNEIFNNMRFLIWYPTEMIVND